MKKEVQAEKLAHKGFRDTQLETLMKPGNRCPFFVHGPQNNGGGSPDTNSTNGSKASRWCAASASRVRKDSDVPVHSLVLRSTMLVFVTEKTHGLFACLKMCSQNPVSAVQLDLNQVMETCNRTWGVMGTCPPSGPYNFHGTQARRPPLRFLGSGIGSQRWDYMNICINKYNI